MLIQRVFNFILKCSRPFKKTCRLSLYSLLVAAFWSSVIKHFSYSYMFVSEKSDYCSERCSLSLMSSKFFKRLLLPAYRLSKSEILSCNVWFVSAGKHFTLWYNAWPCGPEGSWELESVGLWTEEPHNEECFYLVRFHIPHTKCYAKTVS